MRVKVTYVTVGCAVSRGGSPGCGRRTAEELRLAEDARLRLALLGRCIVEGSPAQVRRELRAELKAIDDAWRSRISQEAALSLKRELKAIDAEWRPEIARTTLRKELKAIDAQYKPEIQAEARVKLARAAERLKQASEQCGKLGVIPTQAVPSTALIGIVVDAAIAALGAELAPRAAAAELGGRAL